MRVLDWQGNDFSCAMVEDDNGKMWTTTAGIALALHADDKTILKIHGRHKEQFEDSLRVANRHSNEQFEMDASGTNCSSKSQVREFLAKNMLQFGVKRMRKDLHIWSEDDVLVFAVLCRTPHANIVRKEFLQFIKDNLRREYRREYAQLRAEHDELLQRMVAVEAALPSINQSASASGAALRAHRGTKAIRELN